MEEGSKLVVVEGMGAVVVEVEEVKGWAAEVVAQAHLPSVPLAPADLREKAFLMASRVSLMLAVQRVEKVLSPVLYRGRWLRRWWLRRWWKQGTR